MRAQVMERESFENEEIAKVLNDNFIPIKLDREERPDIDRIYMNFVSNLLAEVERCCGGANGTAGTSYDRIWVSATPAGILNFIILT